MQANYVTIANIFYIFFLPHPQTTKRKPIQSILIHGMCIFRVRAATAARNWSAQLDG